MQASLAVLLMLLPAPAGLAPVMTPVMNPFVALRAAPGPAGEDTATAERVTVSLAGRQLALRCRGEGQPVVVLEAGLGDAGTVWEAVASEVARFTRVCDYDRADLGESDPAPEDAGRGADDVVRDLSVLLRRAEVGEPVVLVGHSVGGLIATMFAYSFPERVAGLVLVDSSHPEQTTRLDEVRPRQASLAWAAFLAHEPSLERWDVAAAFAQGPVPFAEAGALGDLPLVVLSREPTPSADMVGFYTEVIWAGYTLEILEREEEVWAQLQRELADLSSRGEHQIATTNDHYLHLQDPDLVVRAVRRVVEAAR